jgi:hypothetical protein
MIYVLELPQAAPAHVWFAFDGADLERKLEAKGGVPGHPMHLWPDEATAVLAMEAESDPLWQGEGWKARWALREQLIATEALAEN